jgi:hypothetical protein
MIEDNASPTHMLENSGLSQPSSTTLRTVSSHNNFAPFFQDNNSCNKTSHEDNCDEDEDEDACNKGEDDCDDCDCEPQQRQRLQLQATMTTATEIDNNDCNCATTTTVRKTMEDEDCESATSGDERVLFNCKRTMRILEERVTVLTSWDEFHTMSNLRSNVARFGGVMSARHAPEAAGEAHAKGYGEREAEDVEMEDEDELRDLPRHQSSAWGQTKLVGTVLVLLAGVFMPPTSKGYKSDTMRGRHTAYLVGDAITPDDDLAGDDDGLGRASMTQCQQR